MDDSKGGASRAVHITPDEVQRFCEFLYRRTGISFTESKRYFIDHRLEDRIAAKLGDPACPFAQALADTGGDLLPVAESAGVQVCYFPGPVCPVWFDAPRLRRNAPQHEGI